MLFWKLIDLNKVRLRGPYLDVIVGSSDYYQRFRAYLYESGKVVDIVGYILLCCLELKENPGE